MPELKIRFAEGELVGRNYRVTGIAGSGGMGVVYRAMDERLNRAVALKFLSPEMHANAIDRERFLREARTASSLDHPNIGVIHGVEETWDGLTFIVMAFYQGPSLAERLRNGSLSIAESVDIARQMTNGLAAAHAQGIIHRDIKPSNVMLTGSGLVKIVDFGLARVVSDETASQTGTAGTVQYMSPEQIRGSTLDPRSDIWALGVVLCEMLSGRLPFRGESVPAIMHAILHEPPREIESLPPLLQPILYRALAKDAGHRYAACSELLSDLAAVADQVAGSPSDHHSRGADRTAPLTPRPGAQTRRAQHYASGTSHASRPLAKWFAGTLASVALLALALALIPPVRQRLAALLAREPAQIHLAVLPFDTGAANPEDTALADGLMDSLTGRLSNLNDANQSLWVVPSTEVRSRKITEPQAALKQLGANLVVKGSVRRQSAGIHFVVNLIDARNLRQIGSAELDDASGDLSSLESEAVGRLAKMMRLSGAGAAPNPADTSLTPAAYQDYLTALGYSQRFDKPGNLDLAITLLNRAIQKEPKFALGYAQLGEVYRLKYAVELDLKWLMQAENACEKAVQLDDQSPAPFVTLAQIHDARGNHDLALQEFKRALQIDPKNAAALGGLARSYEDSGRIADAEKAFEQAAAMRPDEWTGYNNLGAFYDRQGKYPQSIQAYRQALQITPDNSEVYSNLAAAYLDAGGPEGLSKAEECLKKSIALSPSYPAYANLGLLYLQERRFADSAAATEHALQINGNNYLVWNNLLIAYEGAKQTEKAADARRKIAEIAEQVITVKPRDAMAQATLALMYAYDKNAEKAMPRIRTSLALANDDPNVLSTIGEAYELLGDRTRALEYVHRSIQKGYGLEEIKMDPNLQALIADPRFKPAGK